MLTFLILFPALAVSAMAGVFPYPVHKKTLPNGLDIVVIETPEFKDVLSLNTLVLSGSGDEWEKGKTGLAHLFEHILFRHRYKGEEGGYDTRMNKLGTHNNAWTWFDVTYYHPLTFTSNFAQLLELEAARFTGLDFTEKIFKTETGAVLGEYRKLSTNPSLRMEETLLPLAYPEHAYGHSTMGFYEDVVDMPNQFEAARRFYEEHYRPGNAVVVAAGDLKVKTVLPQIEARYGAWKAGKPWARAAAAAAPSGEKRGHVAWEAEVAPQVWVAYRMGAFIPGSRESAAAQLLPELLVSQASPLYKKLRFEKQSVATLGFEEGVKGYESAHPRLLIASAQLFQDKHKARGKEYFEEVIADIAQGLESLRDYSKRPGAAAELAAVKSKFRYDFLAGLSSPADIANVFSWYYRFNRSPKVLDELLEAVAAATPEDIDALARARFTPEGRVIVTMAHEPKGKGN